MRPTACRLARDPLSCFTHTDSTIQLLYNNFNCSSFTISAISLNASSTRNYYSQHSVSNANTGYHIYPPQDNPNYYQSSETSAVLKAPCLQPMFKNWQEQRKHKLTASTFAGAIGFFRKRRVQLWLEKLGTIEPFSTNLATSWSNIKENEALESYRKLLGQGTTVSRPEFKVYGEEKKNPQDGWLAASPDGEVDVYGLPDRGVLEIKCPYFNGDMSRAAPWKRIPLFHIPQAQGLMEILNRDWMHLYMWTPHGSSLFGLYRDEGYWKVLKIALSDFWLKHVQPAKDICSTSVITNPLTQLRQYKPAPRHELCRDIVFHSRRVIDSSELLYREIHGVRQN